MKNILIKQELYDGWAAVTKQNKLKKYETVSKIQISYTYNSFSHKNMGYNK